MRVPFIPTLIVAAAVAVMVGLGIWQLQRAEWKEALLAELATAANRPAVDLDSLVRSVGGNRQPPPLAFRRARVTCHLSEVPPLVRAGRNRAGQSGYSYILPCFRDEQYSWADRLRVNVGWSARPDAELPARRETQFAGLIGHVGAGDPIMLTADRPLPPLQASAPPSAADIPNNHRLYAAQWFFFAAAAAAIYLLALRRRQRPA